MGRSVRGMPIVEGESAEASKHNAIQYTSGMLDLEM
jgi:hypothetical protein